MLIAAERASGTAAAASSATTVRRPPRRTGAAGGQRHGVPGGQEAQREDRPQPDRHARVDRERREAAGQRDRAGCGPPDDADDRRQRRHGEGGAPQLGLVVDDGPARQVQRDRPRAERQLQHEGTRDVGPADRRAGEQQASHGPLQPRPGGQQDDRGKQHRELREALVEVVGDQQHGQAQQRRHRAEVQVRAPADLEALDRRAVRVDGQAPVEERVALGVVEAAEQAAVAHERAVRPDQHRDEHDQPADRAQQRPAREAGAVVRAGESPLRRPAGRRGVGLDGHGGRIGATRRAGGEYRPARPPSRPLRVVFSAA